MQRLEVSGVVRPLYGSLGVKGLKAANTVCATSEKNKVLPPILTTEVMESLVLGWFPGRARSQYLCVI